MTLRDRAIEAFYSVTPPRVLSKKEQYIRHLGELYGINRPPLVSSVRTFHVTKGHSFRKGATFRVARTSLWSKFKAAFSWVPTKIRARLARRRAIKLFCTPMKDIRGLRVGAYRCFHERTVGACDFCCPKNGA